MTVRRAEFLMTVILGICSILLMWKSTELEIGWLKGKGPGGGAWPFWLSLGMLICCAVTMVRWFARTTPESRSLEPYMDRTTVKILVVSVGSLFFLIAGIHVIGVYFSMALFLLFYMRFVGRHSWWATGGLVAGLPIGIFLLFEGALRIILPKGYSEPLFIPLYKLIY